MILFFISCLAIINIASTPFVLAPADHNLIKKNKAILLQINLFVLIAIAAVLLIRILGSVALYFYFNI